MNIRIKHFFTHYSTNGIITHTHKVIIYIVQALEVLIVTSASTFIKEPSIVHSIYAIYATFTVLFFLVIVLFTIPEEVVQDWGSL